MVVVMVVARLGERGRVCFEHLGSAVDTNYEATSKSIGDRPDNALIVDLESNRAVTRPPARTPREEKANTVPNRCDYYATAARRASGTS